MITACLLHPVAWPFRTVHCPAVSSVRSAQHRPLTRSETGSPSDLPAVTRSADTAALWSSSLLSPAAQQCRGLQAANQPLFQGVRMSWSTSCLKKLKWLPCCPHKLKHCYFCAPPLLLGFTWCKNSATSNAGICTDHILHKIILHWWVLNGISHIYISISILLL